MSNQILVQSTTSVSTTVSKPDAHCACDDVKETVPSLEWGEAFKKLPESILDGEANEFEVGEGI